MASRRGTLAFLRPRAMPTCPSMMHATDSDRRPCRRRVARLLAALMVSALGALGSGAEVSAAALDEARGARGPHEFRLGTAAAPFGWSTAIADFDRDGRPDFAVLDSVGRTAGGYHYRIELLVSSAERYAAAFESPHRALLVAVQDVDRDRHLDLVVTSLLMHEVVAVWLNDGTGRFEQADVGHAPPIVPSPSRLVPPRAASVAAALGSGWRDHTAFVTARVPIGREADRSARRAPHLREHRFLRQSSAGPRAPPVPLR